MRVTARTPAGTVSGAVELSHLTAAGRLGARPGPARLASVRWIDRQYFNPTDACRPRSAWFQWFGSAAPWRWPAAHSNFEVTSQQTGNRFGRTTLPSLDSNGKCYNVLFNRWVLDGRLYCYQVLLTDLKYCDMSYVLYMPTMCIMLCTIRHCLHWIMLYCCALLLQECSDCCCSDPTTRTPQQADRREQALVLI